MIQRIQTVFLLVSLLITGLVLWLPLADITSGNAIYLFDIKGIHLGDEVFYSGLSLVVFLIIIIVLHLVAILMYRKRISQIRILVFTIILLLGFWTVFLFCIYGF